MEFQTLKSNDIHNRIIKNNEESKLATEEKHELKQDVFKVFLIDFSIFVSYLFYFLFLKKIETQFKI